MSDAQKQKAAIAAVALVQAEQSVGLGTGSTTAFAIAELGKRVREEGWKLRCTASSFDSAFLASQAGLICEPLEQFEQLDISIDGADEIDSKCCLIKGGGAAHSREKLMHAMSQRFVVIADSSKRVSTLGERFAVPVEILPSSLSFAQSKLRELGAVSSHVRSTSGKCGPLVSDNGFWILDARFSKIVEPQKLELAINQITGVLENGIFATIRPEPKDCLIV